MTYPWSITGRGQLAAPPWYVVPTPQPIIPVVTRSVNPTFTLQTYRERIYTDNTTINYGAVCHILEHASVYTLTYLPIDSNTPIELSVSVSSYNPDDVKVSDGLFISKRTEHSSVSFIGQSGKTYTTDVNWKVDQYLYIKSWIPEATLPAVFDSNLRELLSASDFPNTGEIIRCSRMTKGPIDSVLSLLTISETGSGVAVRNNSHWASSYDFSCVSTWSEPYGTAWKFTAVTPRHVISANHVSGLIPTGKKIMFCDSGGNRITKTVVRSTKIGTSDLLVTTLDTDLPTAIKLPSFLPSTYKTDYFPTLNIDMPFNFGVCFVSQEDYIIPINIYKYPRWSEAQGSSSEHAFSG